MRIEKRQEKKLEDLNQKANQINKNANELISIFKGENKDKILESSSGITTALFQNKMNEVEQKIWIRGENDRSREKNKWYGRLCK